MPVLVTGASGYLGVPLCGMLAERGHIVRALVRKGAERGFPDAVDVRIGDALNEASVFAALIGCDTLVHLLGTRHRSRAKASSFVDIDEKGLLTRSEERRVGKECRSR